MFGIFDYFANRSFKRLLADAVSDKSDHPSDDSLRAVYDATHEYTLLIQAKR